jgi:predicted RNA-binding Zn-ribbon protein involved in translation (DUF1610 family)
VTPAPVVTSSPKQTTIESDVSLDVGPPIDPSEHVAALVQEAVRKPTVLPATYTILENIGDRISRLTTPKRVESVIIQPKIPQPTSNGISAQVTPAQESPIDPDHAAALVHEAVRKPTVLPETYTILENIGDRISRLTTPKPVDADINPPTISQPDSEGTSAETIEPEPIEADTKKSLDDTHLEASAAATVVAEAPTVEETYSEDAVAVVVEPVTVEETTEDEASTAVVVEPVTVEQTPSDDAVAVVAEPIAVEETSDQQAVAEPIAVEETSDQQAVAEPIAVEETSDQQAVAEAIALEETSDQQAVAEPIAVEETSDQQAVAEAIALEETTDDASDNNTPAEIVTEAVADTETISKNLSDTDTPVAQAEDAQAPTLLQRVSSLVEAVATAFQNPEAEQKDSETVVEPSRSDSVAPEAPAAETVESLTTEASASEDENTQAPSLLERVSSVVEAVVTTLKDSQTDKKNSEAVVESSPAEDETASDSTTVDVACPKCESTNLRKNGRRHDKQRYLCKDCGKQFVLPSSAEEEEPPNKEASSSVETSKVKGFGSDTASGDSTSGSSQPQSKKKTKAKGFGGTKKAK